MPHGVHNLLGKERVLFMSNNHQRAIYNILQEKTIAYNAGLAKALGSVKAAILLSQFLYWQGKGFNKEWFYKTITELYEETALSESEQTHAIKICVAKGVLETKRAGIPAKRHFRVHIENLIGLISSLAKSDKLVTRDEGFSIMQRSQSITYSTHKNTSNKNPLYQEIAKLAKSKRIGY